MKKFGIRVPNYTCGRATRTMREIIESKHEQGYRLLAHYSEVGLSNRSGRIDPLNKRVNFVSALKIA